MTKFQIDSIWPSSLGYTEDERTALAQYLNYLIQMQSAGEKRRLRASNAVRRALGVKEVDERWLGAGDSQHKQLAKELDKPTQYTTHTTENILRFALEDIGLTDEGIENYVNNIAGGKQGRDRTIALQANARSFVTGEEQIKEAAGGAFAPDALVFIEHNGKKYIVIDDFKGNYAAQHTKNYRAQIDEYANRWWETLSQVQREKMLPENFREWARLDMRNEIELVGSIVNSNTVQPEHKAGTRLPREVTRNLTGDIARQTKDLLKKAAGAIPTEAAERIVHTAIVDGSLSDDDGNLLRNAVAKVPTANPVNEVEITPAPKVSPIISAGREGRRHSVERIKTSMKVGVGDQLSAIANGEPRIYENIKELERDMRSGKVHFEEITIRQDIAKSPEEILGVLVNLQRFSGVDVSQVDFAPELHEMTGKPVNRMDFGYGVELVAGDEVGDGYVIQGFRSFGNNDAVMTIKRMGVDHTLPIQKTGSGWVIGGFAANTIVERDPRVKGQTADALGRKEITIMDAINQAATARITGQISGMARPDLSPDIPAAAHVVAQRSRQLRGFTAHKLTPSGHVFWPRSEVNVEGQGLSRIMATPTKDFLGAIPGAGIRSEEGLYFTGRGPNKAHKYFKDIKKALRPQQVLRITKGRGEIEERTGVTESATGERTKGNIHRMVIMGTGAITQGMGYMILPKGAKEARAEANLEKKLKIPPGFAWDEAALAGEPLTPHQGQVRIGYREMQGPDGPMQEPVYISVGNAYDQVSLDPTKFKAMQASGESGTVLSLPMKAYSPTISMKNVGEKLYYNVMTHERAVDHFGQENVDRFTGDGTEVTIVVGSDNIKEIPNLARAVADATGDNTLNELMHDRKSKDEIYRAALGVLRRGIVDTGQATIDFGEDVPSYAGKLATTLEGGKGEVPFITMRVLEPVTGEWTHGKQQLNPEESMLFKTFYPELWEEIEQGSREQRYVKQSVLRANKLMTKGGEAGTITLTAQEVLEARERVMEQVGTRYQPGDLLRDLLGTKEGYDRLAPLRLEGTDVFLPSLQAMAQMSTTDPTTSEELERTTREVGYLLNSITEGQFDIHDVEGYTKQLERLATTEGIQKGAMMRKLKGAVVTGYHYHKRMPEGGVFIPPVDLVEMVPGLRQALNEASDDTERHNILNRAYGELQGEMVTFFRRPETDPIYTALPMKFINPYTEEGLSDIANELARAPMTGQMRTTISDAAYEAASADVDMDTALIKLGRKLSFDSETGGIKKAHVGGQQMTAAEFEKHTIGRFSELGVIPKQITDTKNALRYITLRRATVRGADIGVDASDDDVMTETVMDDAKFTDALRKLVTEDSSYFGSQMQAIWSDMGALGIADPTDRELLTKNPAMYLLSEMGVVNREVVQGKDGKRQIRMSMPSVEEMFLTAGEISEGSLQFTRAKEGMGPAYTNLRIMIGALQNSLINKKFEPEEFWNMYHDVATYSNIYQKLLDLQDLTENEKNILAQIYPSRTGKTVFSPFEGESMPVQGDPVLNVSYWMGERGLKSKAARDVLQKVVRAPGVGSLAGYYVRQAFKGINTPSAATTAPEGQRLSAADMAFAMDVMPEPMTDQERSIAEIMRMVIPETLWETLGQTSKWTKGGYKGSYEGVEKYSNPNLPGKMLPAQISEGEAKLLRNLEKLPAEEVGRIAREAAAPSFAPKPENEEMFEELYAAPPPETQQPTTPQSPATPTPPSAPTTLPSTPAAGISAQRWDFFGKMLEEMVKTNQVISRIFEPQKFGGANATFDTYGTLSNEFLGHLANISGGDQVDIGKLRIASANAAGQLDAAVWGASGLKSPRSANAVNAANMLTRIIGKAPVTQLSNDRQTTVVNSQIKRSIEAATSELFGPGGQAAQSYEWLARSAQEMQALGMPTSQQGKSDWMKMYGRLEEAAQALSGTAETLESAGLDDVAATVHDTLDPISSLLPSFKEGYDMIMSGETPSQEQPSPPLVTPRERAYLANATTEDIQQIPGVGPKIAGALPSLEGFDITSVPGIGEKSAPRIVSGIQQRAQLWALGGEDAIEGLFRAVESAPEGANINRAVSTLSSIVKETGLWEERLQPLVATLKKAEIEKIIGELQPDKTSGAGPASAPPVTNFTPTELRDMADQELRSKGLYLEIPGMFGAPAAPRPAPELPELPTDEAQLVQQYVDKLKSASPTSIKGAEVSTLKKLTGGYAGWDEEVANIERRYEIGRAQKSLGLAPPPLPGYPRRTQRRERVARGSEGTSKIPGSVKYDMGATSLKEVIDSGELSRSEAIAAQEVIAKYYSTGGYHDDVETAASVEYLYSGPQTLLSEDYINKRNDPLYLPPEDVASWRKEADKPTMPTEQAQLVRAYISDLMQRSPSTIKRADLETVKRLTKGYAGWGEEVAAIQERIDTGRALTEIGLAPPPLPKGGAEQTTTLRTSDIPKTIGTQTELDVLRNQIESGNLSPVEVARGQEAIAKYYARPAKNPRPRKADYTLYKGDAEQVVLPQLTGQMADTAEAFIQHLMDIEPSEIRPTDVNILKTMTSGYEGWDDRVKQVQQRQAMGAAMMALKPPDQQQMTASMKMFADELSKASPIMERWTERMEEIGSALSEKGTQRELSREEVEDVQKAKAAATEYSRIFRDSGRGDKDAEGMLKRMSLAMNQVGMYGYKPKASGAKGFMQRLASPKTGFGSELFFTTRMARQFFDPIVQAGTQYQEYENQLNAYRMMSGQPVNRQSMEIINNLRSRQMARMHTGGYIMAGANGLLGPRGVGSQTLADVQGIGGASIGTGLIAAQLANLGLFGTGGMAAAGPIGLAAAGITATGLGALRVAGEAKDTERMKAQIAAGKPTLPNIWALAKNTLNGTWESPGYNERGYAIPASMEFLPEIQNDITSGTRSRAALAYMFDTKGGDEYAGFREAISGGFEDKEYEDRLKKAEALYSDVVMETSARGGDVEAVGRQISDVLDMQIVGLSPEAIRDMSLSWMEAMGQGTTATEARADFLSRITTGEGLEIANQGLLPKAMQGYMQYVAQQQAVGGSVTREMTDFAPGSMTLAQQASMSSYYGAASSLSNLGLTLEDTWLAGEGQLPLQQQRQQLINQQAQRMSNLPMTTEQIQELIDAMQVTGETIVPPGTNIPMYASIDEEQIQEESDAYRFLNQAMQGSPWAMEKLNEERYWAQLPPAMRERFGGGEELPAFFQRQTKRGYQVGYEEIPRADTELGDMFRYGFEVDGEFYEGLRTIVGPGGAVEESINNAFVGFAKSSVPVQVSHKGLDAIAKLGTGESLMPAWEAVEGKGMKDLSLMQAAEGYRDSTFKLSLQFEDLADKLKFIPEKLDISDRLFEIGVERQRNQMDRSWAKFEAQWQWGLEDIEKNYDRQMTRLGWSENDLDYSKNTSQLQFGWSMEDSARALKYATGRERADILRKQQREAIKFSLGQARMDEQYSRLDTQREWAKEDYETAKDRHNQKMEWQREEFNQQRMYMDEEIGLRRRLNQIEREMTMNSLSRQQRSLQNSQQHLALTFAIQQRMQGITQVTNNFGAATAKVINEGANGITVFSDLTTALKQARSAASGLASAARLVRRGGGGGGGSGVGGGGSRNENMAEGGPTFKPTRALLSEYGQEEHVVPNHGSLVLREPRVVKLLEGILSAIQESEGGEGVQINVTTNDPATGVRVGDSIARELSLA